MKIKRSLLITALLVTMGIGQSYAHKKKDKSSKNCTKSEVCTCKSDSTKVNAHATCCSKEDSTHVDASSGATKHKK